MTKPNLPPVHTELLNIRKQLKETINNNSIFFKTSEFDISYFDIFSHSFSRRETLKAQIDKKNQSIAIINTHPVCVFINILSLWEIGHNIILLPGNICKEELDRLKLDLKFDHVIEDSIPYWNIKSNMINYQEYLLPDFKEHAITIMSSGTTGPSKGVMLSFENLFSSALGTNHFYNINKNDCWVLPLPIHHIGGFMIAIRMLLVNGSILISNYRDLKSDLENTYANFISLVPSQLTSLLDVKELVHFKGIILGGSKTPDHLLKKACSLKLPLANSFGLSEMTAQVTSTPICHDFEILKTGGKVLPYRKLEIINNKISYSGPTFFIGYKNRETQKFISSDLGFFDRNHNFNFLGRSDQIFISGGENINPFELENKISSLFNLSNCIIVPVNHFKFGQVPFLFCDDTKNIKRDDLKSKLYPHEVPYQIEAIDKYNDHTKIKPSRNLLKKMANKIFVDPSNLFSYQTYGHPSNETILFLHGFMGCQTDWKKIIKHLQKDYFCISLDLPGHGDTNIDLFANTSDFFEKLKEFIISFDTKVHIVGYSMGGRITSNLLVQYPELFNKVILESTGFGLTNEDERSARFKHDQKLFQNINTQEEFQFFLSSWYNQKLFTSIKEHKDFEQMIQSKSFKNIDGYQKSIALLGQSVLPNVKDKLRILDSSKLLLICGSLDKKYSTLALESQINHIIVDQCSHNIHFQSESNFSQIVKNFFSS